jgi:hypothetical protein
MFYCTMLCTLMTHTSQQHEAFLLVAQMSHFAAGVALARSGHAIAATLVLAVAHTTCGWLAHDYMHGRCVTVISVTVLNNVPQSV